MKLAFLADDSPVCPLIRLYDFQSADAQRLKELFDCLATGSRANISLQDVPGIEPVDGCQLNMRVDNCNTGIVQKGPFVFECSLTQARWSDVGSLTEPFCEVARPNSYQWLNQEGEISFLLSPDGRW
jgi:hypothetical protein